MIGEEFLRRIDNPSNKKLQNLLEIAIDNCRDTLREKNIDVPNSKIESFASTFYYDWEKDKKPNYFFLIQNPGTLQKARHLEEERNDLKSCSTPLERIRVNREYFKRWLLEKNKEFSKKFLNILEGYDLISMDKGWEEYIKSGSFFQDFYATDLIKYRVKTKKIEAKKGGNAELAFQKFLKEEILAMKPNLIFVFGSRSWRILQRNTTPAFLKDGIVGNKTAVTKVHGYLSKSKKVFETHLIPLAHFSQRNNFLRESYYEYLKEGIERWVGIQK